jgi:two-component sensor histidine kinase
VPFFALANVLECLTVAWLVDRFLGQDLRFDSLYRVLGVFLAATIGTLIGGAIGGGTLKLLGDADGTFLTYWQTWFRSDLVGVIALAPLMLGLRAIATERVSAREHIEGFALVLLLSVTAATIFPDAFRARGLSLDLPMALLFPALLLIAIRYPLTYSPIGASAVALVMVSSMVAQVAGAIEPEIGRAQVTIFATVACSLSLSALIAERDAAEERQKMLIRELDHRVKNGLTLVQAVVDRSRESAASIEDFYTALGGRIRSMGKTHSMLSREKWQGLELGELIRTELAPYQDGSTDTLAGPRVVLRPALAQSLSIVLHELSTNAVKHGALSHPDGKVFVTWHVTEAQPEGSANVLVVEWRERGAPGPRSVGPAGFGTRAIRELLKYEAGAEVLLSFPEVGAECTIRLPLSASDVTHP